MNPVNAETLAVKLQNPVFAAQVAEHARRRELLWWLQWRSWQPGGLQALASELLATFAERLGTKTMRAQKVQRDRQWSIESCLSVWREDACRVFAGDELNYWHQMEIASIDHPSARALKEGAARFNRDFMLARCAKDQSSKLSARLESLCTIPDASFHFDGREFITNTFVELYDVILEHMDAQGAAQFAALGQNRVTKLVFERLDFARSERYPVLILGDSRIGKTKSVSIWTAMRPGAARLVTMPDKGSEWDMYTAHADALGMPYTPNTSARALKRSVEFVLQQSGLFITYDESQFALPSRYSRNTVPQRLNWLRCQVIDRGVGCAFFATRQHYQQDMQKFVRITQFQMEQWLGRIAPALTLPADLDHRDMLSAAAALFPGIDSDLLDIIVSKCAKRESGFQYLRPVAAYARFLATKASRPQPNLEDIDAALDEMLPSKATDSQANKRPAKPISAPIKAGLNTRSSVPLEAPAQPRYADNLTGSSEPDSPIRSQPVLTS